MSPLPHAVDEEGQPLDGGPLDDTRPLEAVERGDWTAPDPKASRGPVTAAGRRASSIVMWALLAALLAPLIVLLGGVLRGLT